MDGPTIQEMAAIAKEAIQMAKDGALLNKWLISAVGALVGIVGALWLILRSVDNSNARSKFDVLFDKVEAFNERLTANGLTYGEDKDEIKASITGNKVDIATHNEQIKGVTTRVENLEKQ